MIELEIQLEYRHLDDDEQKIGFIAEINPAEFNISALHNGDVLVLCGTYMSVKGRIYSPDIEGERYLILTDPITDRYIFYNLLDDIKNKYDLKAFVSLRNDPHLFYKVYRFYLKLSDTDEKMVKLDTNRRISIIAFLHILGIRDIELDGYGDEFDLLDFFNHLDTKISSSVVLDDVQQELFMKMYESLINEFSLSI